MLTGMLLHVIEAADPIDRALDVADAERIREPVRDAIVLVDDIHDACSADRPGIEWLPSRGRIEGSAIEINGTAIRGTFHDPRRKFTKVGIGVIETFSHQTFAIVADKPGELAQRRGGSIEWKSHTPCARSSAG